MLLPTDDVCGGSGGDGLPRERGREMGKEEGQGWGKEFSFDPTVYPVRLSRHSYCLFLDSPSVTSKERGDNPLETS